MILCHNVLGLLENLYIHLDKNAHNFFLDIRECSDQLEGHHFINVMCIARQASGIPLN